MTVSSEVRKNGPYTGNGVTTQFPFTFKIFNGAEIVVTAGDTVAGTEAVLVLATDYSVALNADQNTSPGGTVTLNAALGSSFVLFITSNVQNLQEVDLTNQGGFYPEVLNLGLDKLTILVQQLAEKVGRSLILPVSSSGSTELPPSSPSKLIGWDSDGNLKNFDTTNAALGVAGQVTATTAKATPADADVVGYADGATGGLVKFSFANLKTWLVAYLSGLTSTWALSISGTAAGLSSYAGTDSRYPLTSDGGPIVGQFRNLKIDAIGLNNYNCVITADEVVLENGTNKYITQRAVNKTINANGVVGNPLSIMSARAASTWYYRWLWYNAATGLTATLDTSSTAPTAPAGYVAGDYKTLLPGGCRTDASGGTYLLQIVTRGRKSSYQILSGSNVAALPIMAVSTALVTPWASIATGGFIPPTATSIDVGVSVKAASSNNCAVTLAPSNSYGTTPSATNLSPLSFQAYSSPDPGTSRALMNVESSNIYWGIYGSAAPVFSGVFCGGWEDNE